MAREGAFSRASGFQTARMARLHEGRPQNHSLPPKALLHIIQPSQHGAHGRPARQPRWRWRRRRCAPTIPSVLVELFKVDELSKDKLEEVLAVPRLGGKLLRHAENLAALPDVVLEVVIVAFVGDLGKADALGRELLVEVKEVQRGRREFPECGRENGRLERRERRLELRRDQRQGLVLDADLLVGLDCVRNDARVELVERVVEQLGKVLRDLLALLQAAAKPFRKRCRLGKKVVVAHVRILRVNAVELDLVAREPLEDDVLDLGVLLLVNVRVAQHQRAPDHCHLPLAPLGRRRRAVKRARRLVQRERHVARGQDGDGRLLHVQRRAVRVHVSERRPLSLVLRLSGRLERLLRGALATRAVHLTVEYAIVDVHLLRVKVLVKDGAHDGVRIDHHAVLLEEKVDVRVERALASLAKRHPCTLR
eukprot:Opistho-1_new@58000